MVYKNNFQMTQTEHNVLTSSEQFILLKGDRRCGKTESGVLWTIYNAVNFNCTTWIIAPDRKRLFFISNRIKEYCISSKQDVLAKINKQYYFEMTFNPFGSKVYFITPYDLFDVFPQGRKPADFIFIDDPEIYSPKEQRKFHKELKFKVLSHVGNPKVLITYTPVRLKDRLAALWTVTKNKSNWKRIEGSFYEAVL